MKNLSPRALLEAHIQLNLPPSLIERVIRGKNVSAVVSSDIKDLYWNFAFTNHAEPFSEAQIAEAKQILKSADRTPILWQLESDQLPLGWSVQSREVWMWVAADEWNKNFSAREPLEIHVVEIPTPDMRLVFEDAYSSDAQEGDVGYVKLPPEYAVAYSRITSSASVQTRHFAGYRDGTCVAIASVVMADGIAGLYSVATAHGYRGRGFGKQISHAAVEWAFRSGAQGVMLQTEADSAVELMYAKLGFQRTHVGVLLGKNT